MYVACIQIFKIEILGAVTTFYIKPIYCAPKIGMTMTDNLKSFLLSIIPPPESVLNKSNKLNAINDPNRIEYLNNSKQDDHVKYFIIESALKEKESFHECCNLGNQKMISVLSKIINDYQFTHSIPRDLTKEHVEYLPLVGNDIIGKDEFSNLMNKHVEINKNRHEHDNIPSLDDNLSQSSLEENAIVDTAKDQQIDNKLDLNKEVNKEKNNDNENANEGTTTQIEESNSLKALQGNDKGVDRGGNAQSKSISLSTNSTNTSVQNPMSKLITVKSLITFYSKAIERLQAYEPLYLSLPDIPSNSLITKEDDYQMKQWLMNELQERRQWKKEIKDLRREVEILRKQNEEKIKRNANYLTIFEKLKQEMIFPTHFKLFPQHTPKIDAKAKYLCKELLEIYNKLALFSNKFSETNAISLSLEGNLEKAKTFFDWEKVRENLNQDLITDSMSMEKSINDSNISDFNVENSMENIEENISSLVDTSEYVKETRENSHENEPLTKRRRLNEDVEEFDVFPLRIVLQLGAIGMKISPKLIFTYFSKYSIVVASLELQNRSHDKYSMHGNNILSTICKGDTGLVLPCNTKSITILDDPQETEILSLALKDYGSPYMWAQRLAGFTPSNMSEEIHQSLENFSLDDLVAKIQSNCLQVQKLEDQIEQILQYGKSKLHGSESAIGYLNLMHTSKHYYKDIIVLDSKFRYTNPKDSSKFFAEIQTFAYIPRNEETPRFVVKLLDMKHKALSVPTFIQNAPNYDATKIAKQQKFKVQTQLRDVELYINNLPPNKSFPYKFSQLGKALNAFFSTFTSCRATYSVDNQTFGIRIGRYSEFGVDSARCFRWSSQRNVFHPL